MIQCELSMSHASHVVPCAAALFQAVFDVFCIARFLSQIVGRFSDCLLPDFPARLLAACLLDCLLGARFVCLISLPDCWPLLCLYVVAAFRAGSGHLV